MTCEHLIIWGSREQWEKKDVGQYFRTCNIFELRAFRTGANYLLSKNWHGNWSRWVPHLTWSGVVTSEVIDVPICDMLKLYWHRSDVSPISGERADLH